LSRRQAVTLILVAVTVFSLVPMPGSVGESLTTIVSTLTTPVVIVDTTNVETVAYSTPLVIEPTQGTYVCTFKAMRFNANSGDEISIQFTANLPVSLYIMTRDDFQTWQNGNSCTATASVLYTREQVSNDHIDMVAPSTGDYDLVFLNYSSSSLANVTLNFAGVSQALTTVSVPIVSSYPVTETYTATGNVTVVEKVADTFTLVRRYVLTPMIVIVIAALLVFAFRRRSKRRKAQPVTGAPETKAPATGRFCINCGKEIPIGVSFCPGCGARMEEA